MQEGMPACLAGIELGSTDCEVVGNFPGEPLDCLVDRRLDDANLGINSQYNVYNNPRVAGHKSNEQTHKAFKCGSKVFISLQGFTGSPLTSRELAST
jgi:hypothetical protein